MTLPLGAILCGFGKGRFREVGKTEFDENKELMFQPSPETWATLDSTTDTVGDLLDITRKNKGLDGCKVCYHKVMQGPDGGWQLEKARNISMNTG